MCSVEGLKMDTKSSVVDTEGISWKHSEFLLLEVE